MAYKNSDQNYKELKDKVQTHDADITELKSISKFFIIIVACTLVATLVGLGGLYISAFYSNTLKTNDDKTVVDSIYDTKLQIELLKAKNPYLK